jgi:hypothetical protein
VLLRGHVGAGVRTRYGKARRAGRPHWLGWLGRLRRVGRLHGAIRSGRRAAAEILANTTPGAGQRTTAPAAALSIRTTPPLTAWARSRDCRIRAIGGYLGERRPWCRTIGRWAMSRLALIPARTRIPRR